MSTETVNPFLTWAPPGTGLVIQLDYGAMDRMNVEAMRGFGVTRRRGTETGGLLLGRIDRKAKSPVIHIQDFEVVPCEYAFGPSYVLSPLDEQRFQKAVAKWQPSLEQDLYAVGCFRSHTRDGFALDESDASVFREFFPDPLDVALLVKPFATRAAIAGFFLKEKGVLATSGTLLEFKFESPMPGPVEVEPPKPAAVVPVAVAAASSSRPVVVTPRSETPVPTAPERELFAAQMQPASPWLQRLSWGAFYVALLAFGAACGYEYAGRTLLQARSATAAGSPVGLPNADLYSIQLQTSKAGSSVLVKWDRNSAAIQAALYGVLTVTEGGSSKPVKLGFAELRNGTAMYPAGDRETRFRLEIFFKDNRSFAETVVYAGSADSR